MTHIKSNKRDIYVLGTGLSHDGSACLLKNGKICVAIEKERITRIKHDGGNDSEAIKYCLAAEGITLNDLSLVVQNANFGLFKSGNSFYGGTRLFDSSIDVPVVTISHHLAHAYYAFGTSPFKETAVLVIDGCGSNYDDCTDLTESTIVPESVPDGIKHLYAEKDSLYLFEDQRFKCVYKDISPMGMSAKKYPMHTVTTLHSIGSFYQGASEYCFGDDMDAGKLMGLAPYGRPDEYDHPLFELKEGRAFINYGDWIYDFRSPVRNKTEVWKNCQYYADIALWVQGETERAIEYVMTERRKLVNTDNLSYTGGVALNAVANGKVLKKGIFKNNYFTPAAGDNGLAIGCAYYGWLEVLKRERILHDGNSCFGKPFSNECIKKEISTFLLPDENNFKLFGDLFFKNLPLFINRDNITKDNYLIQFFIPEFGVYTVSITKDEIVVSGNSTLKSDCNLYTAAATCIASLQASSAIKASINQSKSVLDGDLDDFMSAVKLDQLYQVVVGMINKNPSAKLIKVGRNDDFIRETAELLARGKIIAWFQGGCEFGPRALGNRGIIEDTR